MTDLIQQALLGALLFIVVFILNVIPAFAPPTWITLSFIGFSAPDISVVLLALTGAAAATTGRLVLAKLSRVIVRGRFLSEPIRENVNAIKIGLENHRAFTFGMFLAYAFSPLPSNYLFIAYGLTTLRLRLVALPFFIGRLVSYSFWVTTASSIGHRMEMDSFESASYVGVYFILSQFLLVPTIYLFARIDWRVALEERRLRWFKVIGHHKEALDGP
jgi:hypothetical protein